MAGAWFLLPRGWLFTVTSPLAFPMVLASWMYADVPATNVLAPDRVRVLAAPEDPRMLTRLLVAKSAVLWLFVAPFCSKRAHEAAERHAKLRRTVSFVAIGVITVAALMGFRRRQS